MTTLKISFADTQKSKPGFRYKMTSSIYVCRLSGLRMVIFCIKNMLSAGISAFSCTKSLLVKFYNFLLSTFTIKGRDFIQSLNH